MKKFSSKIISSAFLITVFLVPGLTHALDMPVPPPPPPGHGVFRIPPPPPGYGAGSEPQCDVISDQARRHCALASQYCQAAREDWNEPKLTASNLDHCAYHASHCNAQLPQ